MNNTTKIETKTLTCDPKKSSKRFIKPKITFGFCLMYIQNCNKFDPKRYGSDLNVGLFNSFYIYL